MATRAVVFDAFGTLVKIGAQRRSYGRLMSILREGGHKVKQTDSLNILTHNVGLAGTAQMFGFAPPKELPELELSLFEELRSITFFPESVAVLTHLKDMGYKIGICSNLAAPYSIPILHQLPFVLDSYSWSYEVGAAKPNPNIYQHVCDQLQLPPKEILFVGDNLIADLQGPRDFGMSSIHVDRSANM